MPRAPRKTEKELRIERDEEQRVQNRMRLQENPLRILKLLARAANYPEATFRVIDGSTDPNDLETPQLRVEYTIQRTGNEYAHDGHVYLMESEEYEFKSIESMFDSIDLEKAEAARKRKIAQEAYDVLSEEQRDALGLRYRPI